MLNLVAQKATDRLLKNVEHINYEREVYIYGFELIISTLVCWIAILINAFLLSEILSGIIFIIVFSSLRTYAGGYHANKYGKCFVISNLFFFLLLIIKRISVEVNIYAWYVILLIAGIYIFKKAPIINKNQHIQKSCFFIFLQILYSISHVFY